MFLCVLIVYLYHFFKKKLFILLSYLFIVSGCIWSSLRRAEATLRCGVRASHCSGFSCCGARALGAWASVVVALGL